MGKAPHGMLNPSPWHRGQPAEDMLEAMTTPRLSFGPSFGHDKNACLLNIMACIRPFSGRSCEWHRLPRGGAAARKGDGSQTILGTVGLEPAAIGLKVQRSTN